jgi:stage II sporulation protein D
VACLLKSMSSPSSNSSRRAFLLHAGALVAAPWIMPGCRRKGAADSSAASSTASSVTPPHNLDDVGQLATFRPPLAPSEPIIRVRVLRLGEAKPSPLRVGVKDQWLMAHSDADTDRRGAEARGLALRGPLQIEMTDRGWSIVDAKGFRASVGPHDTIELTPLADDPESEIKIVHGSATDARAYRGRLRLVSRHDLDEIDARTEAVKESSRAFDVINDVPLESYLPGVLAGELYASWKPETFAAQAVAARSFACTEAAVFAGRRHYDVANTANSQMYLGSVRHDRAHEAVHATRGKLLAFGGLLVSGYYSSCCGGLAANATDAIGSNPVNNVPPLRGRSGSDVCVDAPVYRWKVEHPVEQLTRRIAGYARERGLSELENLQRLAAIDIAAANANGRPTRMMIVDAQAQRVEMSAEDFRRAANYSSPDGSIKAPDKDLRSSNVHASITGSLARFEGFGFGHGVGLCQHGAETLARSGMEHEDILRWYYPEVDIATAYA